MPAMIADTDVHTLQRFTLDDVSSITAWPIAMEVTQHHACAVTSSLVNTTPSLGPGDSHPLASEALFAFSHSLSSPSSFNLHT